MSVGFTDRAEVEMLESGYVSEKSEFGNVYYPKEGVEVSEKIAVNLKVYPWITCFEVDGIKIIK